ncbi:MAG: Asp23/Gls24 family envelope stress response protein [Clostridia bacterium]|nr:Asp23/Gls24 family envelope stress response protein [Clostridia bacterium]
MEQNRSELSVNTEVFEKMAEIAAKEVEGVTGLTKKSVDLKGFLKTKQPLKGVKVENINGSIQISVFVCVDRSAKIKEVAEKVQKNIKDKIQTMTGTAVTKVNVEISDIEIPEENNSDIEIQVTEE